MEKEKEKEKKKGKDREKEKEMVLYLASFHLESAILEAAHGAHPRLL